MRRYGEQKLRDFAAATLPSQIFVWEGGTKDETRIPNEALFKGVSTQIGPEPLKRRSKTRISSVVPPSQIFVWRACTYSQSPAKFGRNNKSERFVRTQYPTPTPKPSAVSLPATLGGRFQCLLAGVRQVTQAMLDKRQGGNGPPKQQSPKWSTHALEMCF